MRGLALLLILLLASCQGPPGVGCPRLTVWSLADQKALLAAYKAEPEGSVVRKAIDDLEYMRDQARACKGA